MKSDARPSLNRKVHPSDGLPVGETGEASRKGAGIAGGTGSFLRSKKTGATPCGALGAPPLSTCAPSRAASPLGDGNSSPLRGDVHSNASKDERSARVARRSFVRLGVVVAAVVAGLTVTGCETAPSYQNEPRVLTKGNIMPLCLVFCQISAATTSHEAITGDGVSSSLTGGTVSGQQSRGQ